MSDIGSYSHPSRHLLLQRARGAHEVIINLGLETSFAAGR